MVNTRQSSLPADAIDASILSTSCHPAGPGSLRRSIQRNLEPAVKNTCYLRDRGRSAPSWFCENIGRIVCLATTAPNVQQRLIIGTMCAVLEDIVNFLQVHVVAPHGLRCVNHMLRSEGQLNTSSQASGTNQRHNIQRICDQACAGVFCHIVLLRFDL